MRKADAVLTGLAALSAVLLAVGALRLLEFTEPDERTAFWIRVAVGLLFAAGAVWALATQHWVLGAFAALLSAITPLAEGWSWVALLAIVAGVWGLVRAWRELTYDRKPSQTSD